MGSRSVLRAGPAAGVAWGRRSFVLAAAARGGLGLLALADAGAAAAQDVPSGAAGATAVQLDADLVRTGLYLIRGGGGNSLLRLSANGMVLIDGKRSGNYRALMAQVRRVSRLSDLPVRVLVLTDHHAERAGTSAQFYAARVSIAAQRNALSRLSLPDPSDAAARSPVISYDQQHTLRLGGVEVQLRHFGNACTDGDTVVHFPDLKVVALGDLFVPGEPEPDLDAGGSLAGWSAVLARVLELDFDRVVPGIGPVVDRSALVSFKDQVDVAAARGDPLGRTTPGGTG
jgi:cyclase